MATAPAPTPAPAPQPPDPQPDIAAAVIERLKTLSAEVDEAADAIGIATTRLGEVIFSGAMPSTEEAVAIQAWLDLPVVPHPTEPGRFQVLG